MKKVISIVSIIIVIVLLYLLWSHKATRSSDQQIQTSSIEATPSKLDNQISITSQPSETQSPRHTADNAIALATNSEESNITYSTKSDPNIQPIDPDTDPANQQVKIN